MFIVGFDTKMTSNDMIHQGNLFCVSGYPMTVRGWLGNLPIRLFVSYRSPSPLPSFYFFIIPSFLSPSLSPSLLLINLDDQIVTITLFELHYFSSSRLMGCMCTLRLSPLPCLIEREILICVHSKNERHCSFSRT